MSYWADRMAKSQQNKTQKTAKQIDKQIREYYKTSAKNVIAEFEKVHNKVLLQQAEGKEITPALLYSMDSYWKMQSQLRDELNKLGEKQIAEMTREFERNFFEIYNSISLDGLKAFTTIDTQTVSQMINEIWCADGKSWSSRVWTNTEKLAETLNEELIQVVTTGKKTSELKKKLQERFGVSYNNADMIARTELAHIQTQAAQKRYEDYGVKEVEIWADEDERRCEVCGKLHQKKYPANAHIPIPAHPRCRCTIVPVVNVNNESEEVKMEKQIERIYADNPELKQEIAQKKYYLESKVIGSREGNIKKAQSVLDGEWSAEAFIRQENLMPWSGVKEEYVMPSDPKQFVQDYQDKLKREIEEYKIQVEQLDYDVLNKYIFCIDCGKPIEKDGHSTNAQKRCPECQEKHRKEYKAQKERERRKKKKNT